MADGPTRLRLVFMGTADFAVPSLDALASGGGHEIVAVYTQPPRPAGRGQRPRPSPIARAAGRHGLAVLTPRTLRDPAAHAELKALRPDLAVVAAYGLILPRPVLDAPRLGCLNVHASLLPRWRGAAPIQRAILAGDALTGVCLMRMDEGLDTGPVYACARVPITPATTAGSLHDELAALGARMLPGLIDDIAAGRARAEPQPGEGVTYAAKIDKAEGRLDWRRSAAELDRQLRALNPWPGCWTEVGGERLNVLAGEPAEEGSGRGAEPGLVLDDRLLVACGGGGALRLTRLQRPGRQPQGAEAFLRGFPLPAGTRLGLPPPPCPATS